MNLLLDSHLLLWTLGAPERRSRMAATLIDDRRNAVAYSVGSLWELAIKHHRPQRALAADPTELRRELLRLGYRELSITAEHALAAAALPLLHKDPFDRLLVAQAAIEGMMLLTTDARVARYPGPIRLC